MDLHASGGAGSSIGMLPPAVPIVRRGSNPATGTDLTRAADRSSLAIEAIKNVVDFDTKTGAIDLETTFEIAPVGRAATLVDFYLNPGLGQASVDVGGQPATVQTNDVYGGRLHRATFFTPVAVGQKALVTIKASGTLACPAESSSTFACAAGTRLPYFHEGTAIPMLFDETGVGGTNVWQAERTLVARVPKGIDVIAAGELRGKVELADRTETTWVTPGATQGGGYLLLSGAFDAAPAAGTRLPVRIDTIRGNGLWGPEMSGWMTTILPFIEEQAGMPLPFDDLDVVKLPQDTTFPGTVAHGMTMLSELYGNYGNEYFEEVLAHENAHHYWGLLIHPNDAQYTSAMVEGMATLAQIDYAAKVQHPEIDRDTFLARRYREHRLIMQYTTDYAKFPPVVVSDLSADLNTRGKERTIWAYMKSSATLDHLRVGIGDESFARALKAYASECAVASCDIEDFRRNLEAASGKSLERFFAQWMYTTHFNRPKFGFQQEPAAEGGRKLRVEVDLDGLLELPIELWLTRVDGSIRKERVVFTVGTPFVDLEEAADVVSVRPSPRHDTIVWSESIQPRDIDFDMAIDGIDVAHCARLEGKVAQPSQPNGEGIWRMDLEFDPRCDVDEDGVIDAADVDAVTERFAEIASAPQGEAE